MRVADALAVLFDETRCSKTIFIAQLVPFVFNIPMLRSLFIGKHEKLMQKIVSNVKEDIKKALSSWDESQEPESADNLINVCSDLNLAGMETTATTLRWAALILAKHTACAASPDVVIKLSKFFQEKIRSEILSVMHKNDKASMSLKQKLPYTNAAVLELQRFANIIAVNAAHRTLKDTSVGNVAIPADTLVFGQISNVLANSPVFKNPKRFLPERFLMDDGVTPNKEAVEQFCPFSIGKRVCLGEGMAKMELFIGLITLVQNFKIEPVKGREIDLEPTLATVMLPKPQCVRLTPV
ncbi:unspecific monooxygenase [Cooperia oncophora]